MAFATGFLLGNAFRDYIFTKKETAFEFQDSSNILSDEEKNQIIAELNAKESIAEESEKEKKTENEGLKQFIGSSKSDKFYPIDCSYAKRIKEENKVWFSSVEEGESAGRTFVDCQK